MLIKNFLSLITIIFSILMIYITVLNYKKEIFNKLSLVGWNIAWLGMLFIAIRPKVVDQFFIQKFNIDIFYVLSVLGILTLTIISYFCILNIKILEKKLDVIIRAESLKEIIDKIDKND
tara:strand:+ start:148 stop:504 length:357 start_codon:yes stop_codon:yes gene_type:complete